MSMMTMGFAEIILLFALGGGAGVPLGVPPMPEDPMLQRIAPDECLYYSTWTGMAMAEAASANHTERLLAEPEIRHLFQEVESRLTEQFQRVAAGERDPRAAMVANAMPKFISAIITRPTAVYLSRFDAAPGQPPDIQGAMVVNLGADGAEIKRLLEQIQAEVLELPSEQVKIGDVVFQRIQAVPQIPPVTWGLKGDHLIFGFGDGAIHGLLERAETPAPQWLQDVGKQLPVERRSTLTYANLEKLFDTVSAIAGVDSAVIGEQLGLGSLTTYMAVSGLDKTGFVSRTNVGVRQGEAGLLSVFGNKPLKLSDLSTVPGNATVAIAGRLDAGQLMDQILTTIGEIEPRLVEQIGRELEQSEAVMGIRFREELLGSLGDRWVLYTTPTDGGLLTGWTLTVDLKDRQTLVETNARLVGFFQGVFAQDRRSPRIADFRHGDHRIYYLSVPDPEFIVAPAWCVSDDEVIVGLYPQAVKARLSAGKPESSLVDRPEVAALFEQDTAPFMVRYQDTKTLFETVYPLLQVGARFLVAAAREEGVEIDMSIVPAASTISKHLHPSVVSMSRSSAGFESVARQTLPGGTIGATAPLLLTTVVPGIRAGQFAQQRMQSMNNLKQMMLAFHNYHDVYRHLPAAYNTDADGKPLLSWRVYILPYIEQQNLYEQFRLDEPWDSEHNRQLIPRMPPVYRAPGSTADNGKTVYLGIYDENGIIVPPDESQNGMERPQGMRFRDVTDGTANTIALVEADDPQAVIWTKPADLVPDKENPINGLVGLRKDGFLTAFCDGSVRFIQSNVAAETLRALFTRNGGEIVNINR